ncbi:MAG: succinylglutamate desuccinylase/aspartoacylase family protein, partial [Dehalococcoidia bacterium]
MRKPNFETDSDLQIEGLQLQRGQRENTHLRVIELPDGSWVEIPLIVLRGAQPGPTFYVGAAIHGDEINGVEILARFAKEVDLQELRGTILLVPVQNPLAFQVQHRYFVGQLFKSPMDQGADPWTSFPGDTAGNIAALISHTLFHRLMQHADYLIDIHTPTTGGRYAPFAFLPPPRCGAIVEECENLAKVFGVDFIL